MKTEFKFIDLAGAQTGFGQLSAVLDRQGGGTCYSAGAAVDGPFDWVPTSEGEHFRVPLLRYRTNGRLPAAAMAFAFELGCRAALDAPCRPKKLILLIGTPVIDLAAAGGPDALEFWIGVALQG